MPALEQMSSAPQGRKIEVLLRAGLKNPEIATVLGTTPGVVAQTAYATKKAKPKKKPSKKRT